MFILQRSVCLLVVLASASLTLAAEETAGALKTERKTPDGKIQQQESSYAPREGDLIFYDDHNLAWTLLFAYAGTGAPLHMGMVVKKTNGTLAVLEAGPDDTVWVTLQDLEPRLRQFHKDYQGTITIRRCKKDLTKDQSADLTRFAQAQEGKGYAIGRLLLQGTWLRSRGPLRELVLGKTVLDRDRWICSELAVAAGTVAKLFDPAVVHANVAYPRDLVDDRRYELSSVWHEAAEWLPGSSKQNPGKK